MAVGPGSASEPRHLATGFPIQGLGMGDKTEPETCVVFQTIHTKLFKLPLTHVQRRVAYVDGYWFGKRAIAHTSAGRELETRFLIQGIIFSDLFTVFHGYIFCLISFVSELQSFSLDWFLSLTISFKVVSFSYQFFPVIDFSRIEQRTFLLWTHFSFFEELTHRWSV